MGGRLVKTYRQGKSSATSAMTRTRSKTIWGCPKLLAPGCLPWSIAILLSVNVRITLFVFLPLMGMVAIVQKAETNQTVSAGGSSGHPTGDRARRRDYSSASDSGGRRERKQVLNQLRQVNERRRQMMVQDKLLTAILNSMFQNMVSIGTGLILLLTCRSRCRRVLVRSRGDFALFVYYLSFVSSFGASLANLWRCTSRRRSL